MTQGMGALDFFLLESGEYLERLDTLVQTPPGKFPSDDELVRLARAFRGSALMANQHHMARAAQGLESVARAIREGRLSWDERVRGELTRAVDDCKVLMRRMRQPEQGDTERAEAIGVALDRLSGRASAALRAAAGPGLDAGGRAFVAREAAAIASVLQRTAKALEADPAHRETLAAVGPSMSALRGVAVLADLPPLGDVLAAIESAVKEVLAAPREVERSAIEVFDAGARALARAAREVVDQGRPDSEAEEIRTFSARLLAMVRGSAGVIPVERLFYSDGGPHILQQGRPPEGAAPGRVEMVSLAEFLLAASEEVTRAESRAQRDLRLFGIAANLGAALGAGGSPMASATGRFAEVAREAIGRGAASGNPDSFASAVRAAADLLNSAPGGDESLIARRLDMVAAELLTLELPPPSPPVEAAPRAPAAVVPAPAPPPPAAPVAPPPSVVAAAAPAWTPAAEPEPDLAVSYATFEQLIAERGLALGSLDELVRTGPTPPPARISSPRAGPAMVVPIEQLAPDEAGVVPIESLLYRGERALERLRELRPQLRAAAAPPRDEARLAALLSEVFDLVELSLGAGR
jgi:hypothetical protein